MISKILLDAIHNVLRGWQRDAQVVLSWFQRYFWMQYTTSSSSPPAPTPLFYQDFKDTFGCNTQPRSSSGQKTTRCFIMISKILLYAIHNTIQEDDTSCQVVLSGFQRYFCMQYTTLFKKMTPAAKLFYQDFKDTFGCNTQHCACRWDGVWSCFIRMSMNNSAAKVQKK